MPFEWDEEKAARNLRKHGISFDEASTVFDDPYFIDYYDPDHSEDEHRYIMIGTSGEGRLLLVAYTERDEVTRLISARKAEPRERRIYEEA